MCIRDRVGAATVSSLMMGFAWGMGSVMVPVVGWMGDRVGLPTALLVWIRRGGDRRGGGCEGRGARVARRVSTLLGDVESERPEDLAAPGQDRRRPGGAVLRVQVLVVGVEEEDRCARPFCWWV